MNIVGEEDGDANAKPREDEEKLRDDCFEFAKMEEVEDVEVRVGDCVVFVDPVDGTRIYRRTVPKLSVFDWYRA